MSSHNKRYCGRRKALADPRREVKCPVIECEYNGRIDSAKFSPVKMKILTICF